ncbi:hypothetical protein [Segetibacter koreensis]|uniref:hypothetical protein n=1 Tax=Segetibacter koreensis TaxID=398037 RepID=UPI0003752515|nr:hypothetical protein [Segetibacter koreensis]
MNKATFLFLLYPLLYCACKQNGSNTKTNDAGKNDTTHFFQVNQYIRSQIAEVNKTPYFIYKIHVSGGKKDSTAINTTVFNQISAQFLQPDINDKGLKKHYTENIFYDQTTKSYTLSYTADDKQLEIQNIDVLLQEDGQTVKRIFIRKFFNYADSSAIEQLSWKPSQSFQINRLVQKSGNKENTSETNVTWNEKS